MQSDKIYMQAALDCAQKAALANEVPVGAVVVDSRTGEVLASAANNSEAAKNAIGHAELLALQQAMQKLSDARLTDCDLFVTLEPCAMCAGAISHARIRRLVFGAYDPKSGAVEHGPCIFTHATTHHKPEIISGVMEAECGALLKDFFAKLR